MREAYNDYLYRKRKETGLRRKQVASSIGVSMFLYHRFERGYSVPKPEVVEKISALYGEDFAPYLIGESSYPAEIKQPEESRFRAKVKEAFRKRWVRLLSAVTPLVFLLSVPAAAITYSWTDQNAPSFYTDTYTEIREAVCHWGDEYSDPLGNSHMKMLANEWFEDGNRYFAAIKAPDSSKNIGDMQFLFTMRADSDTTLGGLALVKLQYTWMDQYEFMLVDNQTGEYFVETGRRLGKYEFETTSVKERFTMNDEAPLSADADAIRTVALYADAFFERFLNDADDFHIFGDTPFSIGSFYEEVFQVKVKGDSQIASYDLLYEILAYGLVPLGVILSGLSLIFFVLSREKTEEEEEKPFGEEPLPENKRLRFLVGTSAYRVLGSLLFLIGSVYILLSLANRFGLISLVVRNGNPNSLIDFSMNLFILGVFFLYILDLRDDFTHPRRLYIRTIAFGTIAFAVAFLQTFFAWSLSDYENNFVSFLMSFMPANIFMSVFLFHLCAMFLFATPQWAKGRLLKLWRWLAIVPALLSLTIFIYGLVLKGTGTERLWVLTYFLGAERFPYSFVTYSYLLGNYILRRHWSQKYGAIYLQGDVYAFYKNMALCVPAFLIGAIELILYFVPGARLLGFGESYALLAVGVLMLFYRGYNDKNYLAARISSRIIYSLGLIMIYSVTIAMAVAVLTLG
ncbi:MAG: helix-turn-helix transcriptional regulator [Bacilli bacterium]|nr:helix-turn-helix transcriptional regulator [Bacilli bacterium]